jgi:hypothetical protein
MDKCREELNPWRAAKMKLLKFTLIAIIVFGPSCFAQKGSNGRLPASVNPVFSITVADPAQPIHLGSPINVTVTVTNISGKEIYLASDKGPNAKYKDFSYLLEKAGHEVETTLFHRRMSGRLRPDDPADPLGSSSIVVPHPPGPIFAMTIDLTRLYEINQPGEYTLIVSRFDEDSKTIIHSNTLTINILP